jgi:hypothetical protein
MSKSNCATRSGAGVRVSPARAAKWGFLVGAAWGLLTMASNAAAAVTIGGKPAASVMAAMYYNFQPSASDSQHKTLKFSIANKPAWAGFDPVYGRLYGTPTPPNVGTYRNIVISVSNGVSTATLPAFSVTVTPLNDPGPVISGVPSTTAVVGKNYVFQPTAHDPLNLRLVFEIYNKPAWLTLNSATGLLSGTPKASDVGTFSKIVESVTDGYKRGSLQAFNLTVSAAPGSTPPPAPPPPPATTPPPAPQPSVVSISLQWEPPTENTDTSPLTDLAGYHVYYGNAPSALSSSITVANAGVARYVIDNLSPGTWYFAVAGYNTSGVEGDRSDTVSTVIQ